MCSKLDINVPQNRERLIIVGIRKDLNQTFTFPVENEENLTTEVKCEIDDNSKVNFSLLNIWLDDLNSVYEDEIDYEDMENDEFGSSMFEKDKQISFNCKNLNLEDFLQEFSHD